MQGAEENPWRGEEQATGEDSSIAARPAASVLAPSLDDNDPWAAAPPSGLRAAAVDDLDPYAPTASASASPPTSASPPAASTSPGTSSAQLVAPLPRRANEEDGVTTPILGSIANAFRKATPSQDGQRARTGGVMAAIAGRGSLNSTPMPSPTSREAPTSSTSQLRSQSEPPPFDFNRFLEQMRDPRSDAIAKYLRSFLKEFGKRTWKVNDQIVVINDFLDFISAKMRTSEIWRHATDQEFDMAIEGMEKLVMNRVFDRTFTPALPEANRHNNPTDDLERDHVLQQRIQLFSWLREEHLDLPPATEESTRFLTFARNELLKVNQYKAPRDKLITILNCCKVIYGLMRHVSAGKEQGADLFVPYLILVVIGANPDHLVSNIQYIQRFRNPERLQGEAGYYLSSLNGAISFVEAMDHSSLSNISQDDFEHQMEQAVCEIEPNLRHAEPAPAQVNATAEPDAVAQPVGSSLFDRPLEALRGAFSDLALRRGQDPPPHIVGGVPARVPGPHAAATDDASLPSPSKRRRGYTPSLYSRSSESLVTPVSAAAPSPAVPTAEEERDRRRHQANISTLAQGRARMFPSAEPDVLAVVLLAQNGDINRAIDSLLDMT